MILGREIYNMAARESPSTPEDLWTRGSRNRPATERYTVSARLEGDEKTV